MKSVGTIITLVLITYFGLVFFLIYHFGYKPDMKCKELKSEIKNEALKNNTFAIELLKKYHSISLENKEIIKKALKGDKNAMTILSIENQNMDDLSPRFGNPTRLDYIEAEIELIKEDINKIKGEK